MTGRPVPATAPPRYAREPGAERLRAYVGEQLYGPQGPQGSIEPADVGTDNPPPEVRAARQQQAAPAAQEGNSDMMDEQEFTAEETAEFEAAVAAAQARQQGDEAAGVPLTEREDAAFAAFELDDAQVEAFNEMSAEDQQSALNEMVARFEAGEVGAEEPRDGGSPELALARKAITPESWEAHLEKVRQRIAGGGRYLGGG